MAAVLIHAVAIFGMPRLLNASTDTINAVVDSMVAPPVAANLDNFDTRILATRTLKAITASCSKKPRSLAAIVTALCAVSSGSKNIR